MAYKFFKTILLASFIGSIISGTFNGIVLDSKNQEPIIGATVIVGDIDLGIGAYTDMDGEFFIDSIPLGMHTVTVRCIGYEVHSYSIRVRDGIETDSKIIMDPSIDSVPIVAKKSGGSKKEFGPGDYARGFGLILNTSSGTNFWDIPFNGSMHVTFPIYKEGALFEPEIAYLRSSIATAYHYQNQSYKQTYLSIFVSIGMFKQYVRASQRTAFYLGFRSGLALSAYEDEGSTSSYEDEGPQFDDDIYTLHGGPTLGAQYFITNNCSFGGEVRYIFSFTYLDGYQQNYYYDLEYYDRHLIKASTSLRFLLRYYF